MSIEELGHRDCHSCYGCFDDWAFQRRKHWDELLKELLIEHLQNCPTPKERNIR